MRLPTKLLHSVLRQPPVLLTAALGLHRPQYYVSPHTTPVPVLRRPQYYVGPGAMPAPVLRRPQHYVGPGATPAPVLRRPRYYADPSATDIGSFLAARITGTPMVHMFAHYMHPNLTTNMLAQTPCLYYRSTHFCPVG